MLADLQDAIAAERASINNFKALVAARTKGVDATTATVVATEGVRALLLDKTRLMTFLYQHRAAALEIYRGFAETLATRLRAQPN